jgi:hypothetical protein
MARKQAQIQKKEKSPYNGELKNDKIFKKSTSQSSQQSASADISKQAEKQMNKAAKAINNNPELTGYLLFGAGLFLLLQSFGTFVLLNYAVGFIAIGLLVYGGWKARLGTKISAAYHGIKDYIEDESSDSPKKSKK